MEEFKRNGINILIKNAPRTPRMAVDFFFKLYKKEKFYGVNSLLARLLLQGTKNYSPTELSKAFEDECIDISFKSKQDYIKASLVFLNEDFKKAMELFKELVINSTFDDFEKEVHKIKGEITSDLDVPKIKLTDCFVRNIFKNHPYSSTHTRVLEDIDKITKEDIKEAHKNLLESEKAIVIAGDIPNKEEILNFFANEFPFMKSFEQKSEFEDVFEYNDEKTIWLTKNDASQAQIIQGWLIDTFTSEKSAKYSVLNNILGSSGLSSRLFVNMRDKQGLAYTVRSQYDTMLHSAIFNLYIGTAPQNIQKSLDGFKIELQKLVDVPPSDKELVGAKENISGRMKYFTQNNSQIVAVSGYNYVMGLGLDYNERFLKEIYAVSKEDVSEMAKDLLSKPKLVTIIAPDQYKI